MTNKFCALAIAAGLIAGTGMAASAATDSYGNVTSPNTTGYTSGRTNGSLQGGAATTSPSYQTSQSGTVGVAPPSSNSTAAGGGGNGGNGAGGAAGGGSGR